MLAKLNCQSAGDRQRSISTPRVSTSPSFRYGPRYKVAVKNRETDQSRLGDRVYDTLDAAKLGALDELLLAKEERC